MTMVHLSATRPIISWTSASIFSRHLGTLYLVSIKLLGAYFPFVHAYDPVVETELRALGRGSPKRSTGSVTTSSLVGAAVMR